MHSATGWVGVFMMISKVSCMVSSIKVCSEAKVYQAGCCGHRARLGSDFIRGLMANSIHAVNASLHIACIKNSLDTFSPGSKMHGSVFG